MTDVDGFERAVERYQLALDEFLKGDPEPVHELWSHAEDVTLANPLVGPPACGWEQVAKTMEHAASQLGDGEIVGFDDVAKYVTPELAYTVWLERQQARVGGSRDVTPFVLRVTMIYRLEDGEWKVAHRQADTITTPRPAEALVQEGP
jgi:ketosteroid isomerase-like protein